MSFFEDLKRRSAVRSGNVYTVATWLLVQVSDTVYPRIGLPGPAVTLVIAFIYEQDGPSMNEPDGPSLARLHVAAQTRESASLLRQIKVMS